MIDTGDPRTGPEEDIEEAKVLAYLLRLALDIPDSLDDLNQLLPDEQILYFLERGKKANKLFPTVTVEEGRQLIQQSLINMRAMAHYEPAPYPGRIVFFQASEQSTQTQDPVIWTQLAQGGGTVVMVPGNHVTMNFPPHVQVLGDKLSQFISELSQSKSDKQGPK
jgi:thioesterase domain-containing protein